MRTKISKSNKNLHTIYLPKDAINQGIAVGERITALIANDTDFAAEGKLHANGTLSGMAALHDYMSLEIGTEAEFTVTNPTTLTFIPPGGSSRAAATVAKDTAFDRHAFSHVHIDKFRPENVDWEPIGETDVYMAFGQLQEFTEFEYCCAVSSDLLRRLGADKVYNETDQKPDAVLVHRTTHQYLIAEFKKRSLDFKKNHTNNAVDVLVCWIDDEPDKSTLPRYRVCLQDISRERASERLNSQTT